MLDIFQYEVVKVTAFTPQVSKIILRKGEKALIYQTGQYVHVFHAEDQFSPLSIATAAHQPFLEFHLFHSQDNKSAQSLLKQAKVDKTWALTGPYGQCTVEKFLFNKPLIFIAKGTGFAPVKAMLEAFIAKKNVEVDIHFYWSLPRREDMYLVEQIKLWRNAFSNFSFTPIFTRRFNCKMAEGQQLVQLILQDHPNLDHHLIYASGPVSLVQHLYFTFLSHGLLKENFYSDVL